jgi:hypothetical protein
VIRTHGARRRVSSLRLPSRAATMLLLRHSQTLWALPRPTPSWRPSFFDFGKVPEQRCRDAGLFAAELADLEAASGARLGRVRANSAADRLVTALPSLPVFSVSTAAAHIGRTFQATSDAVERLRAAGVVRQVTTGRRNRAFEAVGLFETGATGCGEEQFHPRQLASESRSRLVSARPTRRSPCGSTRMCFVSRRAVSLTSSPPPWMAD